MQDKNYSYEKYLKLASGCSRLQLQEVVSSIIKRFQNNSNGGFAPIIY